MPTPEEQRTQLEAAVAGLEAQRAVLGDVVVETALAALRQQLAALSSAPAPAAPAEEGEFKRVTVMFADISGFTALAEQGNPEQVRALMNACFEVLVPIVEKYQGTIDKFVGDAILALFGAPIAHENDPEQALHAALEMQHALAEFNARKGTDLGLHFGINTGLVVAGGIGSSGRQDYSVMGDAVNLASRLEDASERDEILVGPDTYRLTAPLFAFEALPPLSLKGKREPVAAYRLRTAKAAPGSLRGIEGLRSPLVGRDEELARLQEAFGALLDSGEGGALAIMGEAGQGKSRLVAEARAASLSSTALWAEGRALSYAENMSYFVARDLLRGLVNVPTEASPDDVAAALWGSVEELVGDRMAEVYPYLARLLDVALDGEMAERVRYLSAEALQRRMIRAFCDYVRAQAQKQPLVLAWEDLHWADPSSLLLLEALLPLTEEAPLLVLLVFRPEQGRGVWDFHQRMRTERGERYTVIALSPLSHGESAGLLDNLLRIENLPETIRTLILDKAEGNAFFLEELLRSLIDAGMVVLRDGDDRATAAPAIGDIEVPDTLQGVIAARIDRLPAENKRTLQTASVIGRVFQQRVLAHLRDREANREPVETALGELRRREFIHLRTAEATENLPAGTDQEYVFKHVLTQDVTYHTLLLARRRELHGMTGEAMEALFGDYLDELSPTLGYHFERAQISDKAVRYLAKAGDRARATYANAEALAFYQAALVQADRLRDQDDEQAGAWREATLQLHENRGNVLELTARHEDARAAYENALALVSPPDRISQSRLHRAIAKTWQLQHSYDEALRAFAAAETDLGETSPASSPEWWQEWIQIHLDRLWVYYRSNQTQEIEDQVEKVRPLLDQFGTPLQRGAFLQGLTAMELQRGRFVLSDTGLANTRAALAAMREENNLSELCFAQFQMGHCLLFRDELAEAEENLQAALALAERIGDAVNETLCLTYLTVLHRKRGQIEEVRHYQTRSLAAATTVNRTVYIGFASANQAWLAWREQNFSEARANAEAALELMPGQGFFPIKWVALWPLLAALLRQGDTAGAVEQARALLDSSQQPLPHVLTSALKDALAAWDAGQFANAHAALERALPPAQERGYL